jgi:hypothetical protein
VSCQWLKTKAVLTEAIISHACVAGDIVALTAQEFEALSDLQILFILQQLALEPERKLLSRRACTF